MKKLGMIAVFGVALAWANISSATIINEDCWAQGGGLQNVTWGWDNTNYIMSIDAQQMSSPASVAGWFTTDESGDPTITMENTINNDTGFAWTSYDVNVYMNQPFTLADPVVYPDTSEPGWTGAITVSPAVWNGTQWEANAVFTGGTPLQVGDIIDFGYQASFTGSVDFTQQLIPLPEPGTLILALAGLTALVAVRRFRTR